MQTKSKLREIAERENSGILTTAATAGNYDAKGGTPRDAKDVSHGDYECNVHDTHASTPQPSKSVKRPIK